MAGAMGYFDYTSDNGQVYKLRLDASNAAAGGLPAWAAGIDPPKKMRPRYLLAAHPTTGRQRKIVVNPDNALWTDNLPLTIQLPDFGNAMQATAYKVQARIGERRPS
jgi:hypothetical protein